MKRQTSHDNCLVSMHTNCSKMFRYAVTLFRTYVLLLCQLLFNVYITNVYCKYQSLFWTKSEDVLDISYHLLVDQYQSSKDCGRATELCILILLFADLISRVQEKLQRKIIEKMPISISCDLFSCTPVEERISYSKATKRFLVPWDRSVWLEGQ